VLVWQVQRGCGVDIGGVPLDVSTTCLLLSRIPHNTATARATFNVVHRVAEHYITPHPLRACAPSFYMPSYVVEMVEHVRVALPTLQSAWPQLLYCIATDSTRLRAAPLHSYRQYQVSSEDVVVRGHDARRCCCCLLVDEAGVEHGAEGHGDAVPVCAGGIESSLRSLFSLWPGCF